MDGEAGPSGYEDDWSLVRRVVDHGELGAFDVLVVRYEDRIFGLIARLVADEETARDLTQDTFLKAYKGLKGFSGDASFYTWLYRIARNVVTSNARYLGARPKIAASIDAEEGSGAEVRLSARASGPDPVQGAVVAERKKLLLAALAALPAEFREIIVLRDFEDRTYEEIAELLDLPPGTVRSRLHRARSELRDRLRPHLFDPTEGAS